MANSGFVQLNRDFFLTKIWLEQTSEFRNFFFTILINCAWQDTEQDDFGKRTIVKKGQLLITERELIRLCYPVTDNPKLLSKYKSSIHRNLEKSRKLDFSNHETNQRKTIITITRNDIFHTIEPRKEPNSNQTRTIKEEYKNKEQQQQAPDVDVVWKKKALKRKEFVEEVSSAVPAFEPSFLFSVIRKYSMPSVICALDEFLKCDQKKINNPPAFLTDKIKIFYAEEQDASKLANK